MIDIDMDGIIAHDREENAIPMTPSGNEQNRNVFEDIHAEEDVLQFIGSTNKYTITAKSIRAKTHTTQCFGDMADSTFQQISSDRSGRIEQDKLVSPKSKSVIYGQGQRLGREDQTLDSEKKSPDLLK
jgi:hypothetical protein